jgi:CheY-like chemotaxis protein
VGSPHVASDPLCGLLHTFGFSVHTTADTTEALVHASSPSLLASFVRAEMSDGNGGNGIDLCAQLRQASAREDGDRVPLLVLVAARLRPMDRVRAELAGCDEAISAPITRGSVARLLDARGIRLPSDPRQA